MTEFSNARTHSAALRKNVRRLSADLESEQQTQKNTLKKFEELKKSLYELLRAKEEDDKEVMETRVQELKATIKAQEEKLSTEKSDKEHYVKETERLSNLCDAMDDDLRILNEKFEKISEGDKESDETWPDYNNNREGKLYETIKHLNSWPTD